MNASQAEKNARFRSVSPSTPTRTSCNNCHAGIPAGRKDPSFCIYIQTVSYRHAHTHTHAHRRNACCCVSSACIISFILPSFLSRRDQFFYIYIQSTNVFQFAFSSVLCVLCICPSLIKHEQFSMLLIRLCRQPEVVWSSYSCFPCLFPISYIVIQLPHFIPKLTEFLINYLPSCLTSDIIQIFLYCLMAYLLSFLSSSTFD